MTIASLSRIRQSASIIVGGIILLLVVLAAGLAPVLAPADPRDINVNRRLQHPNRSALLGTDHLGRDVLSRILFGGRISLFVGGTTAVIATVIGVGLGLVGGYNARAGDIVMRIVDGLMAFPGTILALALVAVLGPQIANTIIALAVVYTPRVARVEHAAVLQIRTKEYVQAAVGLGARGRYVLGRHILPNTLGPVLVQSTFTFSYAVIAEAGLSFLGVGIPPDVPSWGNIIAGGRDFMLVAPFIALSPGIAILLVVLGLNLMGDGLRDLLDPRFRGRGGLRIPSKTAVGGTQ